MSNLKQQVQSPLDGWALVDITDRCFPRIKKGGKLLSYDECVQVYDKAGQHVLSLVRCHTNGDK